MIKKTNENAKNQAAKREDHTLPLHCTPLHPAAAGEPWEFYRMNDCLPSNQYPTTTHP